TRPVLHLLAIGFKTVLQSDTLFSELRIGQNNTINLTVGQMLSISTNKPEFVTAHDIPVTFVGHPLTEQLPVHESRDAAGQSRALQRDARWVGLLPGSRGAEVVRLGALFFETARWLARRDPTLRFVVPAANDRIY